MKFRKRHLFEITALVAVLTLNVGLYINLNKKPVEVDAYDSSTLPTTIYLDDCTEQQIRSYYSGLNSLDVSERKGTNLLKNLKPILMNNQKYYSYDISSGDKIWKIYEIADRDWSKSPASSTTYGTYNANTNTITNYSYGTSSSNSKNNPYIHALYINRNLDNQTTAWDDHNNNTDWGMNREHIWAKSHGFQDTGTNGARGDPMHLWAANAYANTIHSNNFYAFVNKNRTYTNCGNSHSTVNNNLSGYSKNAGGNQTVFEPQDCDKGDIARSIFYMAARYNNYAGDDDSIDSDNPNLVLLNDLSENTITGTSTPNNPYGMGLLSDLLAWNKLDPVDEYERHRNNLLYRNYTNNRNPFIDFPNWADAIWGTADLDGTNYSSTTVGAANPATDTIGSTSNDVFSISSDSLDLMVDDTTTISANNADGNITWTIGNDSIVSLSKTSSTNGETITVTALASGSTTITATSGGDSLTCQITVTNNPYGTPNHPLTITQAKALIDSNHGALTSEKMYVRGIVTSNSAFNGSYNNFSDIWLQSDDGLTAQDFDLYRAYFTDDDLNATFADADSMQGYEVVAYGYGKLYNTTYELAPSSGSTNKPEIISITPVSVPEKTPKQLVEEKTTSTMLSYRYTKETSAGSATDSLTRSLTGITGTTYTSWSDKEATTDVVYAGQSAGDKSSIQLRSNNNNSGIVVTSNPNSVTATSVTVSWQSDTADGRTLNIYGKASSPYTDPTELYTSETQGTLLGTIVKGTSTSLTINGSYQYIGLRSASGAMYLEEIQIVWSGGSVTTYEYNDVSIRFGGLLSQELWNNLDTENHVIQGFGVMITTKDHIGENEIKDNYNSAVLAESNPDIENTIVNHYMPKAEMSVPPVSDNNYYWNLFFTISNLKKQYVAAAYIRTSTEYVFFRQVTYSAKTLAGDCIANRGYASNVAGGSLNNLANLA